MVTVTVNNFTAGALNPVLAYVVSCLGGFLGLRCVTRAKAYRRTGRIAWLALAAVSIGATAIWAMHFIAMLGFTVEGQQMTYDVPKTIASMFLAILVVGVGLAIVGYGQAGWARIITGGTVIGLGVAAMHYMGMEGMVMPDNISYNPVLVALSIVIAIVAGTAALWAGSHVRSILGGLGASMILGVAVVGMHYTGMWAMHVTGMGGTMASGGASAFGFVVPMVIGLTVGTFGITMVLLMGRSEKEIAEDELFQQQVEAIDAGWTSHVSGSHVGFTAPQPKMEPRPADNPAADPQPRPAGPATGPQPRPAAGPATGPQPRPAAGPATGPQPRPEAGPATGPQDRPFIPQPGHGSGPQVRPSMARERYLGTHTRQQPPKG